MTGYLRNIRIQTYLPCLMVALLALLPGCQTVSFGVVGKSVSQENRIPLIESGEADSEWQTRDLTFDYHYARNQSQFTITGTVYFNDSLKLNFIYFDYFHMDVIFLDSQGKVLEMQGLITSSNDYLDRPIRFERPLILPPGAQSMAFSYRGEARSASSDDDGSSAYFWEYPIY